MKAYRLIMSIEKSRSIGLLDLNQDVLHEIFGYIERNHLYFSVKNVCRAMKLHVESFMPASKKLMLVDEASSNQNFISIVIVYMFKGKSHPPLLYQRFKSPLPSPKPVINSKESVTWVEPIGHFGGVIKERVIAGFFCVEKIAKPKSLHYLWEKLGRKRSPVRRFCRLVQYLYEYEEPTNSWKSIQPYKNRQMVCPQYDHKVQGSLSFSVVGNTFIVGIRMTSNTQWNGVGEPIFAWTESRIAKFDFYTMKDSSNAVTNNKLDIEYSVSFFKFPSQIQGETWFYTASLKNSNQSKPDSYNNNIYLHGFNIINGHHNFFICKLQSRMFKLNVLNDEVRYHKLPRREYRKKNISFNLKGNIFIIGLCENKVMLPPRRNPTTELWYSYRTWKCDSYDIDQDEYYASVHEIPNYVNDIHYAETVSNESYALILTNVGLIKFSIENGFEYNGRFRYLEG